MPARPAGSPRAFPGRLARRLRLPQNEIDRVALVRVVRVVAAFIRHRQHLAARKVAELPERRKALHRIIHAPVLHIRHPRAD